MSATTFNLADYFGTTERPIIHESYSRADGWRSGTYGPVTRAALIELADHGATKVSLRHGTRIADFMIGELAPVGIFVSDPLEGLR